MANTIINTPALSGSYGNYNEHPYSTEAPNLGPQYQQLIDANPYTNLTYRKSTWQGMLEALGFRTKADAWRENMEMQAAEYNAQIAQKAYDEQYNSPAAQVARERNAGLNPDISGGQGISPGEAAPLGQDPSTPMETTGDEESLQQVVSLGMQVAEGCMTAFTTAVGVMGSIQGIKRNHLDNIFQSLQNEGALQGLADQVLPYLIPESPADVVSDDGSRQSWLGRAFDTAEYFAGSLNKKQRRKFETAIMTRLQSAPTERKAWQEWNERVKSRKSYYRESTEFYDEQDDVLQIISEGLSQMNEDIYKEYQKSLKSGYEAQTAENIYNKEYNEAMAASEGAGVMAGAEKSTASLISTNNAMVGAMRANLKQIVDKLDAASKEKGVKGGLASVAMSLISILQLYISSQGMPSISRSQSSGYKVGPRSESQSQSSSFSIGF